MTIYLALAQQQPSQSLASQHPPPSFYNRYGLLTQLDSPLSCALMRTSSSPMVSPRPILKRPTTIGVPHHPPHHVVHFPPSPSLTTHTFSVYSASAYDRSPIVVTPNSCALPERGCPGRTYNLDDDAASPQTSMQRGIYGSGEMHPRAFYGAHRSTSEHATYSQPPPLIPDLSSSESEESDDVTSPHTDSYVAISPHLHGLAIPRDKYDTSFDGMSPALSFLPHPPSPPSRSAYSYRLSVPDDTQDQKPRRHRERKHEGSYDLGRIPSGPAEAQQGITPAKNKKSKVSGLGRFSSPCRTTSSFRAEDDGCLGGF